MNLLEASLEALEIFNMGLSYVLHYARSEEVQRERFKVNLRGTVDRLEALLEKMEE
jgi:hypothetical protein